MVTEPVSRKGPGNRTPPTGRMSVTHRLTRGTPGDPVALAAGPNATQSEIAALAQEFGLDQPLWVQYWTYLTGLVQGDFGTSIFTRRTPSASPRRTARKRWDGMRRTGSA